MTNMIRRTLVPLLLACFAGTPSVSAMAGHLATAQDDLAERRARAEALSASAAPEDLEACLSRLSDSDARTRGHLVEYLRVVELQGAAHAKRVGTLRSLAVSDPGAGVRRSAVDALADLDRPESTRALFELLGELGPAERVHAAERITASLYARSEEARALLESVVVSAFSVEALSLEKDGQLPADVLALLLPTYGLRLAERDDGADLARERAPIVLGFKDPDPRVRGAAADALQNLLARLSELDRHARVNRALERFAQDGVPTRPLAFLRVTRALEEGGVSPEIPLTGARELGRFDLGEDPFDRGQSRARAAMLEANALIALDRSEEARDALLRAGDLLDGLIARRYETSGPTGAARQRDLLLDRALVGFTEVFRRIADGVKPNDLAVLHRLRGAHALLMEAQLVALGNDVNSLMGLDPFFSAALTPCRLIFARRHHEGWPAARCIDQKRKVGRALASVCSLELPGYEPFADLMPEYADPTVDPRRKGLLQRISDGQLLALQREYSKLYIRKQTQVDRDPALDDRLSMISLQMRRIGMERTEKTLAERYYDLRTLHEDALQLAELLRREGRTEECRQVAAQFDEALRNAPHLAQDMFWVVRLSARSQLMIGSCWSDEGDAVQAEEFMEKALERFEGIRSHFESRGLVQAISSVDDEISEVLVALAVNANVKAEEPDRALEFFERAYELRQDDFMRVMLACYRARSGKREEALDLLTDVPESPRGYYNLACTYALLGEKARALDYLEADFTELRSSPGALEKQKKWARSDPDLTALREDPRFELLTELSADTESERAEE